MQIKYANKIKARSTEPTPEELAGKSEIKKVKLSARELGRIEAARYIASTIAARSGWL